MQNDNSKFKNKVYKVVKKIPKGEVLTYKMIAEKAGFPRAWRAVGNILNKNRDPKIPCHRVIRSDGKIGGYKAGPRSRISTKFSFRKLNAAKRVEISLRGGQKRKIELLKSEHIELCARPSTKIFLCSGKKVYNKR